MMPSLFTPLFLLSKHADHFSPLTMPRTPLLLLNGASATPREKTASRLHAADTGINAFPTHYTA